MREQAPFHKRMREARTAAGLSLVEATFGLRSYLPQALWVSVESIRRLEEEGADEAKADPMLVVGLASTYNVEVADLSELVVDELKSIRDLLVRTLLCNTGQLVGVG